jgi:hypothetical protein
LAKTRNEQWNGFQGQAIPVKAGSIVAEVFGATPSNLLKKKDELDLNYQPRPLSEQHD